MRQPRHQEALFLNGRPLGFTQRDLPLRIGQAETLPNIYRSIHGQREAYSWQRPKKE